MSTETIAKILREACDFAGDDRKGEYFAFYSGRLDEIAAKLAEGAAAAERERCASIVENTPEQVIEFWDRPGGPPGNGVRPLRRSDLVNLIRAPAQVDSRPQGGDCLQAPFTGSAVP